MRTGPAGITVRLVDSTHNHQQLLAARHTPGATTAETTNSQNNVTKFSIAPCLRQPLATAGDRLLRTTSSLAAEHDSRHSTSAGRVDRQQAASLLFLHSTAKEPLE
jgi:hypothetical protein